MQDLQAGAPAGEVPDSEYSMTTRRPMPSEEQIKRAADEVEYRVRTVAAHVAAEVKHGNPTPSEMVNREVRAGRARVLALFEGGEG